jgi:hypothetical protein
MEEPHLQLMGLSKALYVVELELALKGSETVDWIEERDHSSE